MSILDYIYEFVYSFFVEPIMNLIGNHFNNAGIDTVFNLTMPGSDTVLISADFHDLVLFGVSIFLLIVSIAFFWGVIKMLYKVGRSFFGGRR